MARRKKTKTESLPKLSNRGRRRVERARTWSRWQRWGAVGEVVAIGALLFFVAWGLAQSLFERIEEVDPQKLRLGQALYGEHCASCHGADLEGQPDWKRRLPDGRYPAPPHDQTGHTWHHDDDLLFRTTKHGGRSTAPAGFLSGMPAFEATLSDDEIGSILAFIKSRWPADIATSQAATNSKP